MSVSLDELLNTPVSELDPDANPVKGNQPIYLDKVRTDMSNEDASTVYRYSCTFKVAEGDFAGRVFFDDIYPAKRDGGVNPYGAKQIRTIIEGALGNLAAVAGRTDIGEVLNEIAGATPPLVWTQRLKIEAGRDGKDRTRLAV